MPTGFKRSDRPEGPGPAGDLLITGAVLREGEDPPVVVHFAIPMNSPHVKVLDNWKTLGMRATGSHDVLIDGHVVPEQAVAFRRKAGDWHPVFQIIATIAFPLVYAVYVGVAEGARDIAIGLAGKRRPDSHVIWLVGQMETALRGAVIAHESMLAAVRRNTMGLSSVRKERAAGALRVEGDRQLARSMEKWLGFSAFAGEKKRAAA